MCLQNLVCIHIQLTETILPLLLFFLWQIFQILTTTIHVAQLAAIHLYRHCTINHLPRELMSCIVHIYRTNDDDVIWQRQAFLSQCI